MAFPPTLNSQKMNWLNTIYQKHGGNLGLETIEVVVTSASQSKYALPDNSLLRNHEVVGFFFVDNPSDDRYNPASGRALVSPAALRNCTLTLKCDNLTVINELPATHATSALTDHTVHPLKSTRLTPDQCTINFGNASTVLTAGECVLLHFYYVLPS